MSKHNESLANDNIDPVDEPAKALALMPSPPEHWLKGSIGRFDPLRFHDYLATVINRYGDMSKIHFFGKTVVVVADPKEVQALLKNRPEKIRRVSAMEKVFAEMGIAGVFSTEGDEWSRHRKLLNPALRPTQLKNFYPTLAMITDRLCRSIAQIDQAFDAQALMQRYFVDLTSSLAFGFDINTLDAPDSTLQRSLSVIFPKISSRLKSPWPYWRVLKLKSDRELEQALSNVRAQVQVFIQSAEANFNPSEPPKNILESLILECKGDHDALFGNIITLLLAGEDTSANTVAWALDALVSNPELQERIAAEVAENYPRVGGLQWQNLDDFPLIQATVQESLRLKPVAPYLYLEPYADCEVGGYCIPKGTMMIGMLSAKNKHRDLFSEPEVFKPERWLGLSDQDKKRYASELMPFGAGPRLCPGMQLAMAEMKLCLIELLRHYRFSRADGGADVEEELVFTLRPKNLMITSEARA